jgi:hypothetical protein
MSRMPTTYKPPLGLPFYWQDEVTGELPRAVRAYLDHVVDGEPITDKQLALLRDYLDHWVCAPCWDSPVLEAELRHLRGSIRHLTSVAEIGDWIHQALEIGMDPL